MAEVNITTQKEAFVAVQENGLKLKNVPDELFQAQMKEATGEDAMIEKFKKYVMDKENREATPEEIMKLKEKLIVKKLDKNALQPNESESEFIPSEVTHSQKAIDMLNAAIERRNKI